jgi:hypothetical protein
MKRGPHAQEDGVAIARRHGLFETPERRLGIPATRMDLREIERGHVVGPREPRQLLESGLSALALSPTRVAEAQRAHEPGTERGARAQIEALPQGRLGGRKIPAPRVAQSEEPVGTVEVRIELQAPAALVDSGLGVPTEGVDQPQIGDDGLR